MFGHHLEKKLNDRGHTLNHSPQSLDRSTVGGWLAARATGQLSARFGGIEDLVVTYVRYYDVDEARHAMQDPSFDKCVMFLGKG
jgi:FAD/FMN-containing dehydrogenase